MIVETVSEEEETCREAIDLNKADAIEWTDKKLDDFFSF